MTTAIAALPFLGASLACFDPSSNAVIETTAAGYFNSTWSVCALGIQADGTSHATSPTWPSAATLWTHCVAACFLPFGHQPDGAVIQWYNGATVVAQLNCNNLAVFTNGLFTLFTLQSGVLTSVGTVTLPLGNPGGQNNTIDIQLTGGASGSASVYAAGTLAFTASSLNHTAWAGITGMQLWGGMGNGVSGGSFNFSQVIADSTSTVGRFLRTDRLNTNSATNTGWTGTVTDINETITNDATFIFSTTNSQISTFFETGLNLGTSQVLARGVGARMRVQGTNPPKIALVIRSGATNFASTTIVATAGFQAAFNSWKTDPHTGIAWTDSGAQSAESGVKSST